MINKVKSNQADYKIPFTDRLASFCETHDNQKVDFYWLQEEGYHHVPDHRKYI